MRTNKTIRTNFFILLFVIILINSINSYAHVESDAITTNKHRFEIGFVSPAKVDADNQILIRVEDLQGSPVVNKSAWIRISDNDKVLFSSNNFITDDTGAIILSYRFHDYGRYSIDISALSSKELAHYSFEIKKQETAFWEYLILALIFVIVFIITKNIMLKHLRKS